MLCIRITATWKPAYIHRLNDDTVQDADLRVCTKVETETKHSTDRTADGVCVRFFLFDANRTRVTHVILKTAMETNEK